MPLIIDDGKIGELDERSKIRSMSVGGKKKLYNGVNVQAYVLKNQ